MTKDPSKMGYTPEWEELLRKLRLGVTEFSEIAKISEPHMAKIARGQNRRELSDDIKKRIKAAKRKHCRTCEQYSPDPKTWPDEDEEDNGSDSKKTKKGGGAR